MDQTDYTTLRSFENDDLNFDLYMEGLHKFLVKILFRNIRPKDGLDVFLAFLSGETH